MGFQTDDLEQDVEQRISGFSLEKQEKILSHYESKKKNPYVALTLSIFLGWLGADRFYLGDHYYGTLKAFFPLSSAFLFGVIHLIPMDPAEGGIPELNAIIYPIWLLCAAFGLRFITPLWWLIDIFLIMRVTKSQNEKILLEMLGDDAWRDDESSA